MRSGSVALVEMNRCYFGDCRDVMRDLIAQEVKVQMCVTSPPYWALRDYGVAGQIGLESSLQEYVENMVKVFRLVRELLADDGVLWLNMGDSYVGAAGGNQGKNGQRANRTFTARTMNKQGPGLKPKDMAGVPWELAFALRADGWYLRQDIIWHKPNPMPETVRDRCTKAHEYMFLLSKAARYFYDAEAIKEPVTGNAHARGNGVNPKARNWKTPDGWDTSKGEGGHGEFHKDGRERRQTGYRHKTKPKQNEQFSAAVSGLVDQRNKRSVWTVATQPYSGAHFATFPPKLIEPCVLAGSRPGDVVLDPFFGSGTTGQVAGDLGRQWIGIELNREYEPLQRERTAQTGLSL